LSTLLQIGLLVFPKVTQLDLTGPVQVFSHVPGAKVHLIWKRIEPVKSDAVLVLTPTTTFADCPQLDVICVPGGAGADDLLDDEDVLAFLRRQAEGAKFVSSVCTGSLVLGAAGLLRGKRAATHWGWRHLLVPFGATPDSARVVRDGNVITGGGVTAGIDFALTVVAELAGAETAQAIQLGIEYTPDPPFDAGSPETAPPAILGRVRERYAAAAPERQRKVDEAAARLGV
jgi:cyclohexyl-isocyanide hydratase